MFFDLDQILQNELEIDDIINGFEGLGFGCLYWQSVAMSRNVKTAARADEELAPITTMMSSWLMVLANLLKRGGYPALEALGRAFVGEIPLGRLAGAAAADECGQARGRRRHGQGPDQPRARWSRVPQAGFARGQSERQSGSGGVSHANRTCGP